MSLFAKYSRLPSHLLSFERVEVFAVPDTEPMEVRSVPTSSQFLTCTTLYNTYNDAIRMGSEKELINIKKHGIDFTMASKVFDDPNFALIEDRIDDETGEQRGHAIEAASIDEEAALLIVVHV